MYSLKIEKSVGFHWNITHKMRSKNSRNRRVLLPYSGEIMQTGQTFKHFIGTDIGLSCLIMVKK